MTVLVTGGAGFIGSHTVDRLLERGWPVRILDSLQPRVHPTGPPPWLSAEAEFLQGEVSDRDTLAKALEGCTAVMHLAAYQDYMPDFSRFLRTNTESMALLYELIVSSPTRYPVEKVVYASSQAVAGEGRYECINDATVFWPGQRSIESLNRGIWDIACPACGSPARPLLIDEMTCHAPHTAYAVSKYAMELLGTTLGRRYGIPSVGLRYSYVQGPRSSFYNAYSGIARRFTLQARTGLAPTCYEDGAQLRDYVNVYDVAGANLLVLEDDRANDQVFNVGGGRGVSVREFAKLVIAAYGLALEPEIPGLYRVGDTRHTVSDLSALAQLGWQPVIPVEENVAQYVEWLDTQPVDREHVAKADEVMEAAGIIRRVAVQA